MIDLAFHTHNRLEYTRASLDALVHNTDWSLVNQLLLIDDDSNDGTLQILEGLARTAPVHTKLVSRPFGGPVAAMLHAASLCETGVMAKIDNDVIVCPGWLYVMASVLGDNPRIDALGMEPGFGGPVAPLDVPRTARPARWIGGVGLIRTAVLGRGRLRQNDRFFGWTAFQRRHVRAAWVSPDLPVFLLDHLPFEPWRSLAAEYVRRGWAREWQPYGPEIEPYWSWWAGARTAIT